MADKDVVKGKLKQGEGKLQNAYGNVTGDIGHQIKGAAKQVGGKVQEEWGKAKDDVRADTERHREDRIERATP